ncbi:MAG TPA: hypothetical protein VIP56_07500, partial [Nitrososphaeraceae archaeon]
MNKNQIIPIYIFITLSIISIITGGIIPTISNFDTQAFAYTPAAREPLGYTYNGIQSSSIGSGLHVSTTNSFYYPLTSSYMHQQYNEYYYGLSSSTSSNSSANRNDFRIIAEQKQHTANNSRT